MTEREVEELVAVALVPLQQAMNIRCPACGAEPGAYCSTVGTVPRVMAMPHASRWRAAVEGPTPADYA